MEVRFHKSLPTALARGNWCALHPCCITLWDSSPHSVDRNCFGPKSQSRRTLRRRNIWTARSETKFIHPAASHFFNWACIYC